MDMAKVIIAVVFIALFNCNAAGQDDINDIEKYYGFDEIEIIKLDWKVKNLTVTDFNGDAKFDIAVVNNLKTKIELLIQKDTVETDETGVIVDPRDADINFINPPTRFKRESLSVAQNIFSMACGDLNSDGLTDIAFYGNPKGLYVILQKPGENNKKTLSWQTRKKIKVQGGLKTKDALVCADLNNDGKDDLILAARNMVYFVAQKKDGTLAEPVKYPASAQLLSIKVGDLNGDKINDLVLLANDTEKPVHVRFGQKSGHLGPLVEFFIEKPYKMQLYNTDGIGGDEILSIANTSWRLMCYKFSTKDKPDAEWPIYFYPLASGEESNKRDLVAEDFDGDGLADVIISEPASAELIFYKQTAGSGLAKPVRFPAFADIESLSAADIDRDGKPELGVLSVKEKVIGLSEFKDHRLTFPTPLDLTGEPVAMELADADGDKKIDCVYISKDPNDVRHLRVIYNLAKTKTKDTDIDGTELKKLTSNPEGLKVLDIDQDGLKDILIFVKYDSPILVRQIKKRRFEIVDSPKAQASLIKNASLSSITVADIDDKSGKELLIAQKNFARSLVFKDGKSWSIIDQYNAKSTENKVSAVAAFDIDGEKSPAWPAIFLLDGQKGQLQILKAGADKTYRFEKELDVGRWSKPSHLKILFTSLMGGKTKNIVLFDTEKFALITPPAKEIALEQMDEQFSYETKIKDGAYGNLIAGDINSDGRVEIVMVEYRKNHIEILALGPDNKPVPAMRFKIFEQKNYREKRSGASNVQPRELKIADVSGDGKNDLITIIHDRIIIYPQD